MPKATNSNTTSNVLPFVRPAAPCGSRPLRCSRSSTTWSAKALAPRSLTLPPVTSARVSTGCRCPSRATYSRLIRRFLLEPARARLAAVLQCMSTRRPGAPPAAAAFCLAMRVSNLDSSITSPPRFAADGFSFGASGISVGT